MLRARYAAGVILQAGRAREGFMQKVRQRVVISAAGVLAALLTASLAPAQGQFKSLADFDKTDGSSPLGGLVQGLDGNFYGTTTYGGANSNTMCYTYNCGTVFRVTPAGALTTLYSFCSQANCADGAQPYAGLVLANDGNLYGTTYAGGFVGGPCGSGCGTAFKITPAGALTTLYIFCNRRTVCADGSLPRGSLMEGGDGSLYGTTQDGGTGPACPFSSGGCGTVFKLSTAGKLTTLHSFVISDGASPYAGLVQGTDGSFYGTTTAGGVSGEGTVFKIAPTGAFTSLYSFCAETNCTDGKLPYSRLIQATDGNFYGTTLEGGDTNWGTVFKIDSSGNLTRLYSFCAKSNCADGGSVYAGLVQAPDGNFYGVTNLAAPNTDGKVFKMTPDGTLTTVHNLTSSEGSGLYGGLVQATSGTFYGATFYGGASDACQGGCGTVFSVSAGLRPFVETLPASGKVGATVKILGTQLIGATSVTFNGVAANFKVVLPSEILTSVPAGATTGTVRVTTPGGTLSSNVPFRVIP